SDYVLKDQLLRLPEAVRRAVRERQLREEHRKLLDDLARSNRDLEQFAYVASHDLQEPLRIENADKYIHYAVDGATRMQRLVQDLLAFSRVGRKGAERCKVDCNACNCAAESAGLHRRERERIERGELPTITAETSELLQLFQNLIGNAIKFRGSDAPVVRIATERAGREWVFSIADNGLGIAPEHVETIFVIFKRLHTRSEYPGNRIG